MRRPDDAIEAVRRQSRAFYDRLAREQGEVVAYVAELEAELQARDVAGDGHQLAILLPFPTVSISDTVGLREVS